MYVTQTKEDLEQLANKLLILENNPDDSESINECFRLAHTIKGNAATMTFEKTSQLAHAMENLLDEMRANRIKIDSVIIDIFFQCVDRFEMMLEAARNQEPEPDTFQLMAMIRDFIETAKTSSKSEEKKKETAQKKKGKKKTGKIPENERKKKKKKGEREGSSGDQIEGGKNILGFRILLSPECKMKSARAFIALRMLETAGHIINVSPSRDVIESDRFDGILSAWIETNESPTSLEKQLSSIKEVEKVTQEGKKLPAQGLQDKELPSDIKMRIHEIRSVRVKMNRLDDLLDSIGELIISKIRLTEIGKGIESKQLRDALQALDRLTGELQFNVLRIRMVPIEIVFSKFPRMVRDLSRNLKKEIDLVIEGNEIELDRSVIDKMGDLLVHLIRNSIDHGIESPEERVKAGKPRIATVRLSASQEQNRVMITVEDDGGGIDIKKIRDKALERGIYGEEELRSMSDDEITGILSIPGFSTTDNVTNVSGRGVGLDAVRTGIETLGGQMSIDSVKGRGTRIEIRLPLTLAIILAMMVRVENETYAIPLDPIIETASVSEEHIKTIGGMKIIRFRGEITPIIYLSNILKITNDDRGSEAIIVAAGPMRSGLVVNEILGQQEIVVKPLDKHLRKIPFFGGATILGSGEVALILDIPGLLDYARDMMKIISLDSSDADGGVIDAG